jgi:hypothetical protein
MAVKKPGVVQEVAVISAMSLRFWVVGRALNLRSLEHLTSAPTVERDLGKRPSAQRFPVFC